MVECLSLYDDHCYSNINTSVDNPLHPLNYHYPYQLEFTTCETRKDFSSNPPNMSAPAKPPRNTSAPPYNSSSTNDSAPHESTTPSLPPSNNNNTRTSICSPTPTTLTPVSLATAVAPQRTSPKFRNHHSLKRPNILSAFTSTANTPSTGTPDIPNLAEKKKSLFLDFSSSETARKSLQSPEVIRFLQLTSPELEKFLSQGGAVVTTPTPTQLLFPKNVTAEQEQYAKGFLDCLNTLHQVHGSVPQTNLLSPGFALTPLTGNPALALATAASEKSSSGSNTLTTNSVLASGTLDSSSSVFSSSKLKSPTRPDTSLASVIMQSVQAFQQPGVINSFSGARTELAASMALLNQSMKFDQAKNQFIQSLNDIAADRPPSQSAPPGTMEFTNLTQAPSCSVTNTTTMPSCAAMGLVSGALANTFVAGINSLGPDSTSLFANNNPNTTSAAPQPPPLAPFLPHPPTASQYLEVGTSVLPGPAHHGLVSRSLKRSAQPSIAPVKQEAEEFKPLKQDIHDLQTVPDIVSVDEGRTSADIPRSSTMNRLPHNMGHGGQMLDLEDQEKMKLERKRHRNRVAADKCRKRKLERIGTLDEQVKQLKDEKTAAVEQYSKLRQDIEKLKATLNEHKHHGCAVDPSNVNSASSSTATSMGLTKVTSRLI